MDKKVRFDETKNQAYESDGKSRLEMNSKDEEDDMSSVTSPARVTTDKAPAWSAPFCEPPEKTGMKGVNITVPSALKIQRAQMHLRDAEKNAEQLEDLQARHTEVLKGYHKKTLELEALKLEHEKLQHCEKDS